jgi:hypothetical protein
MAIKNLKSPSVTNSAMYMRACKIESCKEDGEV